jgi:two-component system nitrogen regulation response regulator NtrX
MKDIIIVDDEKDIRTLLSTILEDEGYQVRTAADSTELFDILNGRLPNVILLDIWLKKSQFDGIEILHKLVQYFPDIDVIMISGHGNIETAVRAMQIGAYSFLEKPIKAAHLLLMLDRLTKIRHLKTAHRKSLYARYNTEKLPAFLHGNSDTINTIKTALLKHSNKDCRVLITGETGTGKYAAAEYIHYNSLRCDASFVAVRSNIKMNAIALEKELFGFSNPDNPKYVGQTGALERANSGTIYLEAIDLYPHNIQKKLIKFLVDKKFTRFMSPEKIVSSDVRVIASVSMSPELSIKNGLLLHDLYVRLCVVTLSMPSLKQRQEDIIPLIKAYSQEISLEYRGYEPQFADDVTGFLHVYDWQKNLRELRNFIQNLIQDAYARHDYKPITMQNMPAYLQGKQQLFNDNALKQVINKPLRDAREIFERDYLLLQLNRFKGNISKTAQFVGMERSALHRKLRTLDIENQRDYQEELVD